MTAGVLFAAVLLAVLGGTIAIAVPGEDEQPAELTAMFIDSEPGDFVGQGEQRYFTPAAGYTFTARTDAARNWVSFGVTSVSASSQYWAFEFRAPPGQALAVGDYEGARRLNGNSSDIPTFSFGSRYRGSNTSESRFTVRQFEVAPDGTLTRLAVSFERLSGSRFVFGELHYHSTGIPLPALIESPQTHEFAVDGGSQTFTLSNPGTIVQNVTISVHGLHGAEFSLSNNTCDVIQVGASCTFDVTFHPVDWGTREGHVIVTDQTRRGHRAALLTGSVLGRRDVALDATPNPVGAGSSVQLSAHVSAGAGTIDFIGASGVLATGTIDSSGNATATLELAPGEYWVIAQALGDGYARSESPPIRVVVAP